MIGNIELIVMYALKSLECYRISVIIDENDLDLCETMTQNLG